MKPVIAHADAIREGIRAVDWYAQKSPYAATRFEDDLDETVARIRINPSSFAQIRGQTRRALLTHYPYAIVFRETETEIRVLAIAHGKRKPGYWRNRTF